MRILMYQHNIIVSVGQDTISILIRSVKYAVPFASLLDPFSSAEYTGIKKISHQGAP